jgi:hypothetical protein
MAEDKDIDIFDKDIDVSNPISTPTPDDYDNPDAPPIDNPIDDPKKPPIDKKPIDDPNKPPIDDPDAPPVTDPDAPPIIDPIDPPPTDPPPTDPKDDKKICLVVKVGYTKGKFGKVVIEYDTENPDGTKETEYAVESIDDADKFSTIFSRNDIVFIEDIVDYSTKDGIYYGEIRDWDVETGIVTIYDENSDSLLIEVDKYEIVKLHNKIDDKEVICKSLTFILAFMPDQASVDSPKKLKGSEFYIPEYYYPDNVNDIINDFISNVNQKYEKRPSLKDKTEIYYTFQPDYLKNDRDSKLALDEKLLKYFIVAVKNNPKYYENNGYLVYLFDKVGNVLKNTIASNQNSLIGDINVAAISDNEVLVLNEYCTNSVNVMVYEDRIAPKFDSDKRFILMFLSDLPNIINGESKVREINFTFPEYILEKMNSFTNLLSTSLDI